MKFRLVIAQAVLPLVLPLAASAQGIVLDVVEAQSTVVVEICPPIGQCQSDTSALMGSIILDVQLDSELNPDAMTIDNFDLEFSDDISITLDLGPLGMITLTGTDLGMAYAVPGVPAGPEPIVADSYTFSDLPTNLRGTLNGTLNLADLGTQSTDIMGSLVGDRGMLTLGHNQSGTIQDVNVGGGLLVDVNISADIVATGQLPVSVPATGTWGVLVMLLAMLVAGTIAMRASIRWVES